MAPNAMHILIPGTCKRYLKWKEASVDVIIKDLEVGDGPGFSG